MAHKNIYGTGGVVFQDLINQGEYIYFPTGYATINKKQVYKRITTNKGKIITKHKGWRLFLTIRLQNFCDTDYINIQKVLHNISYMTNQTRLDKSIYIYPKVSSIYSGFEADNKAIRCLADGMTIKFQKVADRLHQGEYVVLEFISIGLEKDLSLYSTVPYDNLVTNDGSNIITDDYDDIIVVNGGE